jgi:murein DD-endopeptidase MepM/ murein hydrolase activator NlpD
MSRFVYMLDNPEIRTRHKRRLAPLLCSLVASALLPVVSATAATQDTVKNKLMHMSKRQEELHKQVMQLRKKEQIAMMHVQHIERKLNETKGELDQHKHKLDRTEEKIEDTNARITKTQTAEERLSEQAAKRLREIFEGQRISLLEMILQVDSLQSLLDRAYFQERVAETDSMLLRELREKTQALAQKKDQLGEQRNKLGEIISEVARKAMDLAKQKSAEEQVASRLRTQRAFYEQAERQLAQESQRLETQIRAMESSVRKSSKPVLNGSGTLAYPIHAQMTSPFGWRKHPIFGVRKFHTGIDLSGPNHSTIRAADSGTVLYTGWYGGYGKVVIVSHGKGMATLYAHLSRIACETDQNVSKGDVVGYEGTTGFSTGPHVHFEVRVDGVPNNPLNYLR